MRSDVEKYVSQCPECQLAKGTKPHRHGLMLGHKYTEPGTHLCMDLVGPIGTEVSGGTSANHVLVVFDPSTHFPYFIPIKGKTAEEVAQQFVDHVLLEHGAVDSILTDNGTEFKNKILSNLMQVLKTEHQFTPAYHPRGNVTERINRWLGETLRTVFAHESMHKADWPKMIKHLEFVYRRMPIPGTNISPFEAQRGRLPKLPASLEVTTGGSASAYKSLDDTTKEVVKHMNLAHKLVYQAVQKSRDKNKEQWNQHQLRVDFEEGELVRFWNRVPARKGEAPSKLKLRNAVYRVTGMTGTVVELVDRDSGATRSAHVSQLAKFKEPAVVPEKPKDDGMLDVAGAHLWGRLTPGSMVVFHIKGEPASVLRLGEVLESNKGEKTFSAWYYINKNGFKHGRYDAERRMCEWSVVPEWYDDRNTTHVKPKNTDKLYKRDGDFTQGTVSIIAAGFTLQRDKVPRPTLNAIDKWLKVIGKSDKRALKVVNGDD